MEKCNPSVGDDYQRGREQLCNASLWHAKVGQHRETGGSFNRQTDRQTGGRAGGGGRVVLCPICHPTEMNKICIAEEKGPADRCGRSTGRQEVEA